FSSVGPIQPAARLRFCAQKGYDRDAVKPLIILNPTSQGGKTGQRADDLERVIVRYLGPIDAVHTERPRHATQIAYEAARAGRATIVGVGGDGTLHEIVNGVLKARDEGAEAPRIGLV